VRYHRGVAEEWKFLTNHAKAILFICDHPDARLRDLASALDVTERTAVGIVADLPDAGYVVKERAGRRNRYHIQDQVPLGGTIGRERTIGEMLALLGDGRKAPKKPGAPSAPKSRARRR
jgi:hypothetical protein